MARISKEKQVEIRNKIKMVAKDRFDEIGFEKTSTKEIAKAVGIAEGTLFNYFDSKTELFFEVFGDAYQEVLNDSEKNITISYNVGEILVNHFQKMYGYILKIPRGLVGEITIAAVKMAKKHPEKFKKLAQYDFKFIDELINYVKRLEEENIIEPVDEKQFGEMIFSFIAFELLMYIYDANIDKKTIFNNIKTKIDILVRGYIKEEKR